MQPVIEEIKKLFSTFSKAEIRSVDKLPQSGSDRSYYRINSSDKTYIATHGINIKENEAFIYFTDHFKAKKLAVPELLCVSNDKSIYIQEDLGDTSLLHKLEAENFTEAVYDLYKKSLQQLALLQIKGDEGLDYNKCLTNSEFGKQAIMADLLYFKYYFLDALRKPYDKQKLINDFETLSNSLADTEYKYFMFRDFQSRNIMIKNDNSVHFIDYQGGMKGAPQYDVASLLWQAKANLSDEWKDKLLNDYMETFEKTIGKTLDKTIFRNQYNGYVLIRLLQVLGAYGFRGLFERKAHFLTSIPLALQNLKAFINNQNIGLELPEFEKVLDICTSDEVIQQFTPIRATADTPLVVKINSFSYLKTGYPKDDTENGGGFVFDCRGILNPGRIEEFKKQSGLDKGVKDFLEQETKMPEFLNNVYNISDIVVEDYLKRGFSDLMINFGCTGGQHRSVYAAEALARHLKNKFSVKIQLEHMNKKNWGKMKAMIFSAGLGTRFKPWTDTHPKALAIVNGKSLLQRNIEYLQQYGITDVVVNVHHFADQIVNAVKENNGWGSDVVISDETNEVLETGGGLLKAKDLLESDQSFITLNVDILTDLDLNKLIAFHQQHTPLVSFGITNRETSRYFLFDENDRLCGWRNVKTNEEKISINKKNLQQKAYSCVVVFQPEIFSFIRQRGKFSLTETYLDLAAEHTILGYDHSGGKFVDVGKPESIAKAEKLFN